MNKLIMTCVALSCAIFVAGCGNPHEKIVKEFYSVLQSGNNDTVEDFAKKNFVDGLEEMLNYNHDTKKVFGAIAGSKKSVKTEILKTHEEDGVEASLIAAKCDGTTLYFVVAPEKKGGDAEIIFITTDKRITEGPLGDALEAVTQSFAETIMSNELCDSNEGANKKTETKISKEAEDFEKKGMSLFKGMIEAGMDRIATGRGPVFPQSTIKSSAKADDISERTFSSSTEYFKCLLDLDNNGTEDWMPYVEVDMGTAFVGNECLWNIALDVKESDFDSTPVMISANFDCNSFLDVRDTGKVLKVGTCPMIGDSGVVVVYKSGDAVFIPREEVTLRKIFKGYSKDDFSRYSWLIPNGIISVKTGR